MLFTLFFPFALLYAEYEIAQKITKSELNAMGQSLGSGDPESVIGGVAPTLPLHDVP